MTSRQRCCFVLLLASCPLPCLGTLAWIGSNQHHHHHSFQARSFTNDAREVMFPAAASIHRQKEILQGFYTDPSRRQVVSSPLCLKARRSEKSDILTSSSINSFDDNEERLDVHSSVCALEQVLREHRFGSRIQRIIPSRDLPLLGEVYINGEISVAWVLAFQKSSNSASDDDDGDSQHRIISYKEPNVLIRPLDGKGDRETSTMMIDFGQLTTIWEAGTKIPQQLKDNKSSSEDSAVSALMDRIPETLVERALDRLYTSRVGLARSSSSNNGLTKKQIHQLVQTAMTASNNDHDDPVVVDTDGVKREHFETILRKVLKAGRNFSRLVDSEMAAARLTDFQKAASFRKQPQQQRKSNTQVAPSSLLNLRTAVSKLLAQDAKTGGRFKRWPSICISVESIRKKTLDSIKSITIVNGGWLVVDQSIRASTEARKFAERILQQDGDSSSPAATEPSLTAADERITRRLECLAMGEALMTKSGDDSSFETRLELDVREALQAMDLPQTPEGARLALIRMGRWTGKGDLSVLEPWPKPIVSTVSAL